MRAYLFQLPQNSPAHCRAMASFSHDHGMIPPVSLPLTTPTSCAVALDTDSAMVKPTNPERHVTRIAASHAPSGSFVGCAIEEKRTMSDQGVGGCHHSDRSLVDGAV